MTLRLRLAGLVAMAVAAVACTADAPPAAIDSEPASTLAASTASTASTTTTAITVPTTVVPPLDASFEAIADRTSMSEEARRLLALSNPQLVDVTTLGTTCTLDPVVSVLGCYRSGQIAVLAVTDPRLEGMVEATTAHEVLHAAWAMLDDSERARVTGLVRTIFDRVATAELTERIEVYRDRDPATVDGELHSILGTEVADVGPELEAHYRRWFTDRSSVVALAVAARATLDSLEAQVDELDARLDDLRSTIGSQEAILSDEQAALEARSAELDAMLAAGRIEEYNAAVGPFNERVRRYNDSVSGLHGLIDQFNALVVERNALAAAYTDLVAQITTSAESLPTS